MRRQVSILKSLVFVFTITLLTLGTLGNRSSGAPAHPQIYWTDLQTGKIQQANLDGTNVQDVVDAAGRVTGGVVWSIALDVASGKMYWTSWFFTGKIQQANLDGSNVQDIVVTTELDFPVGIALDVAAEKIYWTYHQYDADTETYMNGKIQCANLDGSNVQDIITTELGAPAGIALDVASGKVYWTVPETGKIQRANLDGSNLQDIITTRLVEPSYIALDVAGGKMYWTDSGTGKIQRANLDGSNLQDIITTELVTPVGIALDVAGGKMYWTDSGTGKIQRANLDGTNAQDIVTGLTEPISIALSIPRFTVDVNGDGIVNIQDLVLVAGAFGETGENAADVNSDGVVNIQDLVLVAGAFGTAPQM